MVLIPTFSFTWRYLAVKVLFYIYMLFIFSTPVLVKTSVAVLDSCFLAMVLIHAVLFLSVVIQCNCHFHPSLKNSNLYLNVVHFFNTSVNQTSVAAKDSCFPAMVCKMCSSIPECSKTASLTLPHQFTVQVYPKCRLKVLPENNRLE